MTQAADVVPTSDDGTHSLVVGYVTWLFGFFGAHRFYYGRPLTGTIWFFTAGLLLIGWVVDLFLVPSLHRSAGRRYRTGPYDYNVTWLLQTFIGVLGAHRFYLGKWVTGLVWLLTGGVFLIGWYIDFLTLNEQIDERNRLSDR